MVHAHFPPSLPLPPTHDNLTLHPHTFPHPLACAQTLAITFELFAFVYIGLSVLQLQDWKIARYTVRLPTQNLQPLDKPRPREWELVLGSEPRSH